MSYRVIIFILFVLCVLLKLYLNNQNKFHLRNNHEICCGYIKSIRRGRAANIIYYEYTIKGITIFDHRFCSQLTKTNFEKGADKILIVYEKGDIRNNRLLENNQDFNELNILDFDTLGINCPNTNFGRVK